MFPFWKQCYIYLPLLLPLPLLIDCLCAKPLQSCPALWYSMDYGPFARPVHGILQARILEQVAMASSRGYLPDPGVELTSRMSPALAGVFFMTSASWEAHRLNIEYVHPNFICGCLTTIVMVFFFNCFLLAALGLP